MSLRTLVLCFSIWTTIEARKRTKTMEAQAFLTPERKSYALKMRTHDMPANETTFCISPPNLPEGSLEAHDRTWRRPSSTHFYTWPNGTVPLRLKGRFRASEKRVIEKAAAQIEGVAPCVRFVARTNEEEYVLVTRRSRGCYANIGYTYDRWPGFQPVMNLEPRSALKSGCFYTALVVHELLHILGTYHEHTRPDRDHYIRVDWSNIRPGLESDFFKNSDGLDDRLPLCSSLPGPNYDECRRSRVVQSFGTCYDYKSIMHYGAFEFARNKQRPVLIPRDTRVHDMKGSALSESDIYEINEAYHCPGERSVPACDHPVTLAAGMGSETGATGTVPGISNMESSVTNNTLY